MVWLADGPWRAGPPGGGLCLLLGALLLSGLLLAAWAFWRRDPRAPGPGPTSPSGAAKKPSSAEDVLADRYARGDLTEEEYWERLSVLRESQNGRD